jgi:hypothetical protein
MQQPPPGANFVAGLGPAMAAPIAGGGLMRGLVPALSKAAPYLEAAGQGLGNLALEGFNYLTQSEQDRPSALGAGARSVAQAAIPLGIGKIAENLSPLLSKAPPPVAREGVEIAATQLGRGIRHEGQMLKRIPTDAKEVLDKIVDEADAVMAPKVAVDDLISTLSSKEPTYGATEFVKLIDDIKDAAAGRTEIGLVKLHKLLRGARASASTPMERKAVELAKRDIMESLTERISATHPLGEKAAELFTRMNGEIATTLDIAEGAIRTAKNARPMDIVRMAADADKIGAIQALDHMQGTNYAPQVRALAAQIEQTGQMKAAAGVLKQQQEEARRLLKGLLIAASTVSGSAFGTGYGVSGFLGAIFGASFIRGAIPGERLVAGAAKGASAIATPATAVANQAISEYE